MSNPEETGPVPEASDLETQVQELFEQLVLSTKTSNKLPNSDDFPFQYTFPAFRRKMNEYSGLLLQTMQHLVNLYHPSNSTEAPPNVVSSSDDSERFDVLVEVLDNMLERADIYLDEASGVKKKETITVNPEVQSMRFRDKTVVYAAANIIRPQLKFEAIDNTERLWAPILKEKPHAIVPYTPPDQETDRVSTIGNRGKSYPNPYETEIKSLECPQVLLHPVIPQPSKPLSETPVTWIDSVSGLERVKAALDASTEFAVDLEHHNMRSFQGFSCLMQLSTRHEDFLIDVLEVRQHMQMLNSAFTNPRILKVLHGADFDVLWLQRDFGIYVVNLFDTGQATRVLGFPSFGLAYLLKKYCNITADKKYQLADWRIRPLPMEMLRYAREDTHYLLYISDHLRNELIQNTPNGATSFVSVVFERSKLLSLKTYVKEVFDPLGYRPIYEESQRSFSDLKLRVLSELYAWRDQTARNNDESVRYVLPNQMLLNLADRLPTSPDAVLSCCVPVPPLVRVNAPEIADLVQKVVSSSQQTGAALFEAARSVPSVHPISDSNILTKESLFAAAEWKEKDRSQQFMSVNPSRSVKTSAVNMDYDSGIPLHQSLRVWDSDEEDSACLAEREQAEAIRRTISLSSFLKETHSITLEPEMDPDEMLVRKLLEDPVPETPSTPTQDSFPKSIKDVYQLSNYTRKRNKEKKQLRSESADAEGGNGSDHEDSDNEAKMPKTAEGHAATVAFLKEVGWGAPEEPLPEESETAAGTPEQSNQTKHRRRKSKGSVSSAPQSASLTQASFTPFDYSQTPNPFMKPPPVPQQPHFSIAVQRPQGKGQQQQQQQQQGHMGQKKESQMPQRMK